MKINLESLYLRNLKHLYLSISLGRAQLVVEQITLAATLLSATTET